MKKTTTDVLENGIRPDRKIMQYIYSMLDYREAIQSYVDLALASILRSLELIEQYSTIYYPKRKKPWKWLFPKKVYVKYRIPEEAKPYLPNVQSYNFLREEEGTPSVELPSS